MAHDDSNEQRDFLPPHGTPPKSQEPPIACVRCYTLTDRVELAQLGARCWRCYRDWCGRPPDSPDVGDKRADGPRAWAYALKRRDEAGEPMLPVIRDMYRAALRSPTVPDDDVSAFDDDAAKRDLFARKRRQVEDYARQKGIDL